MKIIEFNKDGTVTIDGEVFVRQQSEVVDKEALLQEAKKRYPIGTEVISVDNGVSYLIDNHNTMRVGDYGIHVDVTDGIDISVVRIFEFNTKRWAEILPSFPTIEEIYGSVKSCYWACQNGKIGDIKYVPECTIDFTLVPTKEDAEYILASMMLINIAKYYNDKYPNEKQDRNFWLMDENEIVVSFKQYDYGQILLTESAAKEAIQNPNVIEVLNKYFKIK